MTTKKQRPLKERQKLLVDYLPEHNWDFLAAGVAAGYSRSYAASTLTRTVKKDARLCKMIEEKRQEISAGSTDKRDKAEQKLLSIAYDLGTKPATAIKALDVVGKMNAWHTQNISNETDRRQNELDGIKRAAIQRLALLWHGLPVEDVTPLPIESAGGDVTTSADGGPAVDSMSLRSDTPAKEIDSQPTNSEARATEGPLPPKDADGECTPPNSDNFSGMNI